VTEGVLFDRAVIDAGLLRLDEVLVERSLPHQRLVVVGGSYLALADLRHATRDIDTITRITDAIRRGDLAHRSLAVTGLGVPYEALRRASRRPV